MGATSILSGGRVYSFDVVDGELRDADGSSYPWEDRDWMLAVTAQLNRIGKSSITSPVRSVVEPEFGATGTGVEDDTNAIQEAMSASSTVNGVCSIHLPWGRYRITRSLKLPAGCVKLVVLGDYTGGLKPDAIPIGTIINCKEVTGPVFELWDAVENGQTLDDLASVCFENVTIDGANGGGRLQSSTTCTGLMSVRPGDTPPSEVTPTYSVRLFCVHVMNLAAVGAKGIDLSRAFWVLVENSSVWYVVNGYGIYINSSYFSTTTVTIRKTYLRGCLECAHMGSNVLSAELDSVVFEASLIALSSFLNPITLKSCWFEALGTNYGTEEAALTLRDGASGDPISTFIYQRGGTSAFDHCTFFGGAGQIEAWMEGDGTDFSGYGSGGSALFRGCVGASSGLPFLAASTPLGDFVITVEDDRMYYSDGTASGVASRYADARRVSAGTVNVTFGEADARRTTVTNGRFAYEGAGALTEAPDLGANLKGDRVRVLQPNAGEYSEYICTADGTALDGYVGTWKGVGLVQE